MANRVEDYDAPDYRAFFDSDILRVWHLEGREKTLRIVAVKRFTGEKPARPGEKKKPGAPETQRQPMLLLATVGGKPIDLPLLLNKTNAKTIAQLYGNRPLAWAGRLITLYPTTTEAFGKTEDCIRIRNYDPSTRRQAAPTQRLAAPAAPPPEDEPRSEENEFTDHDLDVTDHDDEPPSGALETDHAQ